MEDESSAVMPPMVDFWGVELSGKQRKQQWPKSEEELDPDVTIRLELRQACLGSKAKSGERNVVELTAEDENGQEATHSILSLSVGGTEQSPLFIEVFPPVTFHLVSGSGPLHIVGNVHTEFDELESDEEEDEEEDSLSSPELMKSRKRAAADSPPSNAAKTIRLAKENGDDKETSEEEDSEEESDEDDEEDSEEESDKEEVVEEKVTKKTSLKPTLVSKPKTKRTPKPPQFEKQKPQFNTPQLLKGSKTSGKVILSAPTTPEQSKSAKKVSKSTISVEDMKEKLKKTPNLPRKLEKFSNYVQHNFKVTDEKVKKQLWEFSQKVRAAK